MTEPAVGAAVNLDDDSDEAYLVQEGLALLAATSVPAIVDQAGAEEVGARLVERRGWIGRVKSYWAPLKKKAFDLHKDVCKRESDMLGTAEADCRRDAEALSAWETKQRRDREIAAARAAEVTKVAVEVARRDGTIPANVPVVVPPTAVVAPPAKIAGLTYQEQWSAEITDAQAVLRAVADGKLSDEAMHDAVAAVQGRLDDLAGRQKSSMDFPGARAVSKQVPKRTGR